MLQEFAMKLSNEKDTERLLTGQVAVRFDFNRIRHLATVVDLRGS